MKMTMKEENGNREKPALTPIERVAAGMGMIFAALVAIAFLAFFAGGLAGCKTAYKGAKITEGTDLAVGISIPAANGAADFTFLNWLSGFRLGVAENARLRIDYSTAETNSYFGVIETRSAKRVEAKVEPCEIAPN